MDEPLVNQKRTRVSPSPGGCLLSHATPVQPAPLCSSISGNRFHVSIHKTALLQSSAGRAQHPKSLLWPQICDSARRVTGFHCTSCRLCWRKIYIYIKYHVCERGRHVGLKHGSSGISFFVFHSNIRNAGRDFKRIISKENKGTTKPVAVSGLPCGDVCSVCGQRDPG